MDVKILLGILIIGVVLLGGCLREETTTTTTVSTTATLGAQEPTTTSTTQPAQKEVKILFYGTRNVPETYRIEHGYSKFKLALEEAGYVISQVETPITEEVLDAYKPDILVIPETNDSVSIFEIMPIKEYVEGGGSLFVCGTTYGSRYYSTEFGIMPERELLVDETSKVWDSSRGEVVSDNTSFFAHYIERQDPELLPLIKDVNQLAFFGANELTIMDVDVKSVVYADWDAKPAKIKNVKPTLAAAKIYGKGRVFVLSDADVLTDEHVDTQVYRYDNLKFGLNIIDWLKG